MARQIAFTSFSPMDGAHWRTELLSPKEFYLSLKNIEFLCLSTAHLENDRKQQVERALTKIHENANPALALPVTELFNLGVIP